MAKIKIPIVICIVSLLLPLAWVYRNHAATGHWAYSSNAGRYLWDNIWELKRVAGKGEPDERGWARYKGFEGSRELRRLGIQELKNYTVMEMGKAWAYSLAN